MLSSRCETKPWKTRIQNGMVEDNARDHEGANSRQFGACPC